VRSVRPVPRGHIWLRQVHPETLAHTGFRPDTCNYATLPLMHPDLNLNIAHQDSPLPLTRVPYGAGRGGFSPARPRPYNGPEELFWWSSPPRPRPARVPADSLDGAPFLPTCFNGDPSGEWAGPGAGAGNPKKPRPAPGLSAGRGGELGRGPAFFRAPEAP